MTQQKREPEPILLPCVLPRWVADAYQKAIAQPTVASYPFQKWFLCPDCGAIAQAGATYCVQCGALLHASLESERRCHDEGR
jgi:hypothetical protein